MLPSIEPYRDVADTLEALTVFEPRTEPYRDVPEIVEPLIAFEPMTEPYRDVPDTLEALTVFEPRREPYKLVLVRVKAFTVFEPRTEPYRDPKNAPALTFPDTLSTVDPVSLTHVLDPTHNVYTGLTLAIPTFEVVVKAAKVFVNFAIVVASFPMTRTFS